MKKIENYYKYLEKLKFQTDNEQGLSSAFLQLLQNYASEKNFIIIAEARLENGLRPDGTVRNDLRLPVGYWEAKDSKDNLAEEIAKKLKLGYPTNNIIFEDTENIVLIQNGETIFDTKLSDKEKLHEVIESFLDFEPPEIKNFTEALEKFAEDVPNIIEAIQEKIEKEASQEFKDAFNKFEINIRTFINDSISKSDIVEMLIQHILTEDIFSKVFQDFDYHKHNKLSLTLQKLESMLLGENNRKVFLRGIRYYYSALETLFLELDDYREKQNLLIVVYEEFYKALNPKKADTLGIVYTPLEIVDFMINTTDKLLKNYFQKELKDEKVAILDPATGTGTFTTQIIEYLPKEILDKKLDNEIFANEISLLPYYIANLNIEYLYFKRTGKLREFKNIVLGDTLNIPTERMWKKGKELEKKAKNEEASLFFDNVKTKPKDFGFRENYDRVKAERKTDFTVIIGNPPYNANQQNENDNNKNKTYEILDMLVKEDYVKTSSAQKTKVYDMYSRFYRWGTDRINKKGMITFITNSSFIDSKTFDGFRKTVFKEFSEIYVIDLGGNVRKNPKLSGTRNNVFGIQTGVAIMILIKRRVTKSCKLWYLNPFDELEHKTTKLDWLKDNCKTSISDLKFKEIIPDKKGNWLNQTENDWDDLLPMGTKECKLGKNENAIFKLFSLGVATNRDEWVYDFDKKNLEEKVRFFIQEYNNYIQLWENSDKSENIHNFIYSQNPSIKFTSELENYVKHTKKLEFLDSRIYKSLYRPFLNKSIYFADKITHRKYLQAQIFSQNDSENISIGVSNGSRLDFTTMSSKSVVNLALFSLDPTQTFPLHIFKDSNKVENITNFALEEFNKHYGFEIKYNLGTDSYDEVQISKLQIFNYIYAVLHFPEYRKKYEINLKQDLPRIPLYKDFDKFAGIGKQLLDLHTNFENAPEFEINFGNIEYSDFKSKSFLNFFPKDAFEYKLGNRSALEWVIDGYKEKKPKDPTIRESFDKYCFSDYKDEVLSLLKKITSVSLQTLILVKRL